MSRWRTPGSRDPGDVLLPLGEEEKDGSEVEIRVVKVAEERALKKNRQVRDKKGGLSHLVESRYLKVWSWRATQHVSTAAEMAILFVTVSRI